MNGWSARFIKTPTTHAIEILGDLGFDFVVIDEEHAPFNRESIDVALLAARASGTAGIVRVADATASRILSVLDCGADRACSCRMSPASRSPRASPRPAAIAAASAAIPARRAPDAMAAMPVLDHVDAADAQTTVIAMIEDPEAVENIEAIIKVDGIDGVFIGRGDLTVAFGAPSNTAPPSFRLAVERHHRRRARGRQAGLRDGRFSGRGRNIPAARCHGVHRSSDQRVHAQRRRASAQEFRRARRLSFARQRGSHVSS